MNSTGNKRGERRIRDEVNQETSRTFTHKGGKTAKRRSKKLNSEDIAVFSKNGTISTETKTLGFGQQIESIP